MMPMSTHCNPCVFLVHFVFSAVIQFFDSVRVDRTQNWLYAACSLSYLGAMVSSNSALQFVNYPTQVKKGRQTSGWGRRLCYINSPLQICPFPIEDFYTSNSVVLVCGMLT